MADKQINPNLRKLAELTYNPKLNIDETIFEKQEQTTIASNLEGFIYVPSVNLYVAKERSCLGKDWNESQRELRSQKLAMPTPYQFREFLKYLRNSSDSENQRLFKEIKEVRSPWRANWINARFEKRKQEMYMISENALKNINIIHGTFEIEETKLDDFLDKDRTPGISLDDWLDSNARHGLPQQKIKQGDLYYWYPRDGAVARFVAVSGRADLSCGVDPLDSDASLGVRLRAAGAPKK